jgi:hypothetical protein
MAVDFSSLIYLQCQDTFGRSATFTPLVSAPSAGAYASRGIFTTRAVEIQTDQGMAVVIDHETIFDIRDNEWFDAGWALPLQGDLINIPAEGGIPAEGDWKVMDVTHNGGGETTLVIQKYGPAAP